MGIDVPTAGRALEKVLSFTDVERVLDVGSGAGIHAQVMRDHGLKVTTNSLEPPADHIGDFLDMVETEPFCLIWAAHVLEHQQNVGLFLRKCWRMLRPGGRLCVTVPPAKDAIVGGHLTLWNPGLLLYNLIVAGFDCREASVLKYGYNITAIVTRNETPMQLPPLRMDSGDIEALSRYFPAPVEQGFDGNRFININW